MAYIKTEPDGRIASASINFHCGEGEIELDLPEGITIGNITEYRYVDGEWIYDPEPEPEPEPPKPAAESVTYDELAAAIREGVNSYGQ